MGLAVGESQEVPSPPCGVTVLWGSGGLGYRALGFLSSPHSPEAPVMRGQAYRLRCDVGGLGHSRIRHGVWWKNTSAILAASATGFKIEVSFKHHTYMIFNKDLRKRLIIPLYPGVLDFYIEKPGPQGRISKVDPFFKGKCGLLYWALLCGNSDLTH